MDDGDGDIKAFWISELDAAGIRSDRVEGYADKLAMNEMNGTNACLLTHDLLMSIGIDVGVERAKILKRFAAAPSTVEVQEQPPSSPMPVVVVHETEEHSKPPGVGGSVTQLSSMPSPPLAILAALPASPLRTAMAVVPRDPQGEVPQAWDGQRRLLCLVNGCDRDPTLRCGSCRSFICVEHQVITWTQTGDTLHERYLCPSCSKRSNKWRILGVMVFIIGFIVVITKIMSTPV